MIDMSRVRYVDSSGLGVLIGMYVTFERTCKRLLLVGLNDRVWDLFRMCKIEDVFTRYPTVADAEQTVPMSNERVESRFNSRLSPRHSPNGPGRHTALLPSGSGTKSH